MTITHKEFLRLLPRALDGKPYSRSGNHILIEDGSKIIMITLSDESTRKIGAFTLPRTYIRIELQGFTDSEYMQFKSGFDLAFQKGGG